MMLGLTSGTALSLGRRRMSSSSGTSVASMSAPKLSMMRLIHSSWMACSGKGLSSPRCSSAVTNVVMQATPLMVSWKHRNLRMFSRMARPHTMASTSSLKSPS